MPPEVPPSGGIFLGKASEESGSILTRKPRRSMAFLTFLGTYGKYIWRPQRDSNPRYRRERAMSWASRRWGQEEGEIPSYHARLNGGIFGGLRAVFHRWRRCPAKMKAPMSGQDEFYRIQKLPPYVFAVINE